MFKKILIANRGEIAIRITRTARRMGILTVAIYSDADKNSLHVTAADEAYYVGPSAPSESYLNIGRIIEVALKSGAEAVHPGYGFLSENPDFVEALKQAGLVFIGPSAACIRKMGLKNAAKDLMAKAGIPILPGYYSIDQSLANLRAHANLIGYPILIKAVAGGGGKGMRLVEQENGFAEALQAAKSEALGAFGNGDVILEAYLSKPRHIEIQIFGNGEKAIHLFERDCTLQRRYQKVIEEAPAPGMSESTRAAMGATAVRAAEAIGYEGAGTVEFIVDCSDGLREGRFWFMEMNTRLQVEHPVTEAVTGVDLVEWQLRIASGSCFTLEQKDVQLKGHAFEARLYAEDVTKGFMPVTGRLDHLCFPVNSRNDSSLQSGDEISPYYDPMIAKVIVHGSDRCEALKMLSISLRKIELAGCKTNLSFLIALAEHPDFATMAIDTRWIDRKVEELTRSVGPSLPARISAVLTAVKKKYVPHELSGFSLWSLSEQKCVLYVDDLILNFKVVFRPDSILINDGAFSYRAMLRRGLWYYNERCIPTAKQVGNLIWVFEKGGIVFNLREPLYSEECNVPNENSILAPMPGFVSHLPIEKGEALKKGDTVAILEAMKMQHTLVAPRSCVVQEVYVTVGDQVEATTELVRLNVIDKAD